MTIQRILIVIENESVPADRRVWLQCRALAAAGYGVSVICPGRPHEPRFEVRDGISLHRYPEPPESRGVRAFLYEFAYSWMRAAMLTWRVHRREGFDVLQSANPPDIYFPLALAWKAAGKPFVFDQHDLAPELFVSRFGRGRPALLTALRLLERGSYLTADHVITTNRWYADIALRRGRLSPDRVTVVRNGPDLATMRPRAPRPELREGRSHLCCFLGVMEPHDGLDLLLRAVRHLVHDRHYHDCHFALLGAGDAMVSLQQLARDLEVDEWVTFTGWAEDDAIIDYLSTADVGLQPDPKDERTDISTATKTMEYMAFGLPVVAFDLRETRASAGDAGLYAEPNDPVGFAQATLTLLEDPARRQVMGKVGRERVEQHLAWEHQQRVYVDVFERLSAGAGPRAAPPPDSERTDRRGTNPASPGRASAPSVRVDTGLRDDEWDAFVDATGGDHLQTNLWSRVKAGNGWEATRIKVYDGDALVGGCQMLVRRAGRITGVGYVPRGPLVAEDRVDVLEAALQALERFARRRGLLYLKLQPPPGRWDVGAVLRGRGYAESALAASPQATVLVDVRREPEDILRAMRKSTRYNVRVGSRRGLATRLGDAADLNRFYTLVAATAARQGFEPYPREYYTEMWSAFAPQGKAALILSEHEGVTLSARLVIAYGDTAVSKMGGWNGQQSKLGPNEAMDWRAIEWAKDHGYRWYDLGGIDVDLAHDLRRDPTLRPEGAAGYKVGFGGEIALFPPAWDRTPRPVSAALGVLQRSHRGERVIQRLLGRRPAG